MKLLTFSNILGIILVVLSVSNISYVYKKKKALGEMILNAKPEFTFADKSQLILLTFVVVLMAVSVITSPASSENLIFYITVTIGSVCFWVSAIIPLTVKPGFYKNGVATGAGFLGYNEIKGYESSLFRKSNDVTKILFNSSGSVFTKGIFLCVDTAKFHEAKSLLKKRINYKG